MVTRRSIVFSALFLGVFLGALVHRYRNSMNYGQLHVKLPAELANRDDISVRVKSKFGTLGELIQSPDDPLIWGMRDTVPSAVSLVLVADRKFELSVKELIIRFGEHWVPPFNDILPIGEATVLPESVVPEEAFAMEVPLAPVHTSAIPSQSRVVNWQGDAWLFIVPLVQASLVVVIGSIFMRLWTMLTMAVADSTSSTTQSLQHPSRLLNVVGSTLRVTFLILAAHQLRSVCGPFWNVRWGDQFLWASLIFTGLATLIWSYAQAVCTSSSPKRQRKLLLGLLFVVGVAKVIWVASIDSAQTADFRDYWRHGQSMAKGDWRSISDPSYALLPIIVERAYVFVLPLVKCFGASLSALELINVAVQLLTLAMFAWLVQRMFDFQLACLSVPFLVIYPDFWYSPNICTHDTPGYFWILTFLCLFELVRSEICHAVSGKVIGRRFVWMALLSILLGISFAMVNLQRSFGPFLLLGIVLYSGVTVVRVHPKFILPNLASRVPILILVISFSAFAIAGEIQRTVKQELKIKVGPFRSTTTMAYVTAVDSTTDATWTQMHPWRFLYYPQVPESEEFELIIRKLIHEKLVSGLEFWKCVLRKNYGLSINTLMMEETFGGSSAANFSDARRVPWYSMHKLLCNACYAATLCLFITRLICLGRLPVTSAELYPLCYCVAQYLTILFATELAFTYDEFTAFPFAWSSGLILRELTQMRYGIPQRNVQNSSRTFGTRWICFGTAGIAAMVGTQCGLGFFCSNSGLGFLRPIPAEEFVREIRTAGVSSFSDVHCALSSPPDRKQLKKDESFHTAFKLSSGDNRGKPLAFFVSGNQRAQGATDNVDWAEVPATYSIRVDGREFVAGPVQDLSNIRFVTVKVDDKREVLLEMELKYLSDFRPPSVQLRPAVAVEYVH